MERHGQQHYSEWNHRSTTSTTTTTTIAGLSWPPRRNAYFLKPGYSGLESSLCLDFDPIWSTHHVRSSAGGKPPPAPGPLKLATVHHHHRLSAAPPVPPFPNRKEIGGTRSGEEPTSSRASLTAPRAGNDAVTGATTPSGSTSSGPTFDAAVMGLGELRTEAHTNAKQPLYNFLARCRSPGRLVGDAKYWRGAVLAWCEGENLRPVDLSTKQVSLYLRQMSKNPTISSYYGISKIDEAGGASRFALAGRPYDWSQFEHDEGSKARLTGWTCVAAGEDGRRTFSSCGSGANVKVQIGKPSYAQVCELEAVFVNGVDVAALAVFQAARELGRFADPEGLRKMLAALSPVSLCTGIRREDAGPKAVAEIADLGALVRGLVDESTAVSAKVEVVDGNAVCWSSKCSRLLVGATSAPANSSSERDMPGDAARRCKECTTYLNAVLLPRVRETCAAAAAAATTVGIDSSSGTEKRGERKSAAGTKRGIDGARDSSPVDDVTTHQHPKPVLDERRREVSPQAATATKREKDSADGSPPTTEGVSIGQKAGVTVWRADDGSARKRFKKRACSDPAIPESSFARRHPPAGGGEVVRAALGLSTLRTIPRHRWALNNSERRGSLAC
eukprot:g15360.t1